MANDTKDFRRYRLKLCKLNELKFISHLDWQNLILKSLRRAEVKLALSEGFNPMPKVSYSPALPIFIESVCELVNFITTEPLKPSFREDFEKCISKNAKILDFVELPQSEKRMESLETLIQWAQYEAKLVNKNKSIPNLEKLQYTVRNCLPNDDLFIKKVNKKGIEKNVNYRTSLHSINVENDLVVFTLKAGQSISGGLEIPALRADEFLKAIFGAQDVLDGFDIKRTCLFDKDLKAL